MIAEGTSESAVEVLLSTFNGERYIATQLASILNQSYANIRLLVRDDGSTDQTVGAVRTVASRDSRVRVVEGDRLGSAGSFGALLAASGEGRWLAFADQDDVWLPDRLARAVAVLERLDDGPALYGSAMLHVGDGLRPLGETPRPRMVAFENALVQNVIPGCTMVMNRAARALCLERLPSSAQAHDWWLYLIVAAFGTVVFDEEVTILHRVHADNATASQLWWHWPRRVAEHWHLPADRSLSAVVREFSATFGGRLSAEKRAVVDQLLGLHRVSWWARARSVSAVPVFRQTRVDNAILRMLMVLGRF